MGRLTRVALAILLAMAPALAVRAPAAGFTGFGEATADATYDVSMEFSVELDGGAPDELELLLRFAGTEADFVAPVVPTAGTAIYVWDAAANYVSPNTEITYRWRATEGEVVTESEPGTLLYDDDRPAFDWRLVELEDATVHWYGDAEGEAMRVGALTSSAADEAEALLGTTLAAPVDIFVYDTREDFLGALGPATREWTGAAANPRLRTVFMWREGGSPAYLEAVLVHEVTHVVFFDATDNPFTFPARWLNEGFATWSETKGDDDERGIVEAGVRGGGLIAFEALSRSFPIDSGDAILGYAQGTSMIQLIVDRFGTDALAAIAAAYRDGADDAEALEAGTGLPADELYAAFYAEFGAEAPQPVDPEPILPSNVDTPPAITASQGDPVAATPPPSDAAPADAADGTAPLVVGVFAAAVLVVAIAAVLVMRRAARRATRDAP